MNVYAVVTADIINSRIYDNISGTVKSNLVHFPKDYLLTPFTLSRGDELQAVCCDITHLPEIIRHLRFICTPAKLRVGIGIGDVQYPEGTKNSWDMDGKTFHLARKALDSLKNDKQPGTVFVSENVDFDLSVNTIYKLMDVIAGNWTLDQWVAVQAYDKHGTYEKAADYLKVKWQNVQKRCNAARWYAISEAEKNVSALFRSKFSELGY